MSRQTILGLQMTMSNFTKFAPDKVNEQQPRTQLFHSKSTKAFNCKVFLMCFNVYGMFNCKSVILLSSLLHCAQKGGAKGFTH